MSALITVGAILVMVSLNALYVAAEFATVGARRSRLKEMADGGDRKAARLLPIVGDAKAMDNYVATCQVGITLSSLVAGAYGQAQLTPLLEPHLGSAGRGAAVALVLVAITVLQVVLGELLPKTAALRHPERLAVATLGPMRINQVLFRPLVVIFNGAAFALMRRLGLAVDHSHAHVHSPEELVGLYRASAAGGLIDAAERDMLAGVLNVEARQVREIMTPRRRLVTVSETATVDEALTELAGSPHSRFPVESAEGDDLVALVHLRDLFTAAARDPDEPVTSVARPVTAVADLMTVPALWQRLQEEGQHAALVVNEYGSISGMATLEDALEEILGEVHDEFDLDRDPVQLEDGRVTARGDVLLTVLNDRFGLRLPTGGPDTVGGLVWHQLGRLPRVGEAVAVEPSGLEVRVEAMDGRAVEWTSFELPEGLR